MKNFKLKVLFKMLFILMGLSELWAWDCRPVCLWLYALGGVLYPYLFVWYNR